jgi:hypothetical protein
MSLSISQSRNLPETAEDSDEAEPLEGLRETNLRLQLLVCELLAKNQQLRFQRANGTHEGEPCLYVDRCRVEDERIVERVRLMADPGDLVTVRGWGTHTLTICHCAVTAT